MVKQTHFIRVMSNPKLSNPLEDAMATCWSGLFNGPAPMEVSICETVSEYVFECLKNIFPDGSRFPFLTHIVWLVILALSAPVPSRRASMKKLTVTMAVPPVTAGDLLPSINLTTFSVTTALVETASFSTLLERVCWIFSPNKVSLESEKSFRPYFKQEMPSFSRILVHLIWEINADILPIKCYIIDITSVTGTSMSGFCLLHSLIMTSTQI